MPKEEKGLSVAEVRRDSASGRVRELAAQNRARLAEFKKLLAQADGEKKNRDECNAKANDFRQKRAEEMKTLLATKKAFHQKRELANEFAGVRISGTEAKARMEAAEWALQTESTSPEKEKRLSLRVRELEKIFIEAQKKDLLQAAINDLGAACRKAYAEVGELEKQASETSAQADSHHKKMLQAYAQADKLREKISGAFAELDEARKTAGLEREKIASESSELSKKRAGEKQAEESKKREEEIARRRGAEELAKKIFDDFKAGKAISSDEMAILRDAGVFLLFLISGGFSSEPLQGNFF